MFGEELVEQAVVWIQPSPDGTDVREPFAEHIRDISGCYAASLVEQGYAGEPRGKLGKLYYKILPAIGVGRANTQRKDLLVEGWRQQRTLVLVDPIRDRRQVTAKLRCLVMCAAKTRTTAPPAFGYVFAALA